MYVSVYMCVCVCIYKYICICVCLHVYGEQKHMCLQWCVTVCNDIFSESFCFSTLLRNVSDVISGCFILCSQMCC